MTSANPQPGANPSGTPGANQAGQMGQTGQTGHMGHMGHMGQMMPQMGQMMPQMGQMMPQMGQNGQMMPAAQPPAMQSGFPWSMSGMMQTQAGRPQMIPMARGPEETYVENILRMNRGKIASIYTTNENNPEWAAKVFTGRVENAARDHVVLSDPTTGTRVIIFMVNIDYITFAEPLAYDPAFYRG